MKIKFKKVKIHHFLSMNDAEINLENAGYTLVSGVNKKPENAAKSNGSGKSSCWSAICYALTGETIQGLKTGLANNITNDGCYVELTFSIDDNEYVILRSKDDKIYKTNLKIYINGEDKSGKGIRESQTLLNQFLPDLTSSLVGSVIILGQGLPHKFTDNTPSGRKETLEKLSKSDFMIQDIKDRVTKRIDDIDKKLRDLEDKKLISETELRTKKNQLTNVQDKLNNLKDVNEIKESLQKYKDTYFGLMQFIFKLNEQKEDINKLLEEANDSLNPIYDEFNSISAEMSEKRNAYVNNYTAKLQEVIEKIASLKAELLSMQKTYDELSNITDICPTCGQKLIDVKKPDTSEITAKIKDLKVMIEDEESKKITLEENNKLDEERYKNASNECRNDYESKTAVLRISISEYKNNIIKIDDNICRANETSRDVEIKIKECEQTITYYLENKNQLEEEVKKCEQEIAELTKKIENIEKDIDTINTHKDVINKINTLVKRDFRGFLLTNVIDFINMKSKEYCKYIFDKSEVEIKLDGNDITIEYDNIPYENLSGGEKQKIDLIIQFAIRDMLCQFLDFNSNLLVLDEIFDNLDSIGCSRVLNLISEKLSDIESIFIITHHQEDLAIPYDYELIVTKNENGLSEAIQK